MTAPRPTAVLPLMGTTVLRLRDRAVGAVCLAALALGMSGCSASSATVNPAAPAAPVLSVPTPPASASPAPAPAPPASQPGPTATARMWMTRADGSQKLTEVAMLAWQDAATVAAPNPANAARISVDSTQRFQTMTGFGAAITDASAWLINPRMSASQRAALIDDLFSKDRGIGLSMTRLTIGASDFSQSHYSYSAGPGQFDLSPVDADIIPVMLAAKRANPDLWTMASPWSAPAWMKSNGSLIQGQLAPARHADFANYLSAYVRGMAARGVTINALSIQNEPHFEPTNYPGMRVMPLQRAAFIGQHLGPLFARDHGGTQILDWDHNWDQPESPEAVLADAVAAPYISGVAWHCYAGDVTAQSRVHDRFPTKDVWFTECSGGEWDPDFGKTLGWMTRNLIIGTTRNWARGVMMWNIALDPGHGPHLGGCGDCRGVVTIDGANGTVTRNVEYYVLAHASRFVRRGAQRIASDSGLAGVETVAFRNADDGSIAMILTNSSDGERQVQIAHAGRIALLTLPAGAVASMTWPTV